MSHRHWPVARKRSSIPEPERAPAPPPASGREPLRVLFVEDRPADAELCLIALRNAGFDVVADIVETREELTAKLRTAGYDVVLSDYGLQGWTGADALDLMHGLGRDIPFILVTGSLGDEAAVDCVKLGAADYVIKDRLARLPVAVRQALARERLRHGQAEAVRALKVSEQRYRSLVENSPDAILLMSDWRWTFANQAAARVFGAARREDLIGRPMLESVEPAMRDEVLQRIERSASTGKINLPIERRLVRLDGSLVDVDVVAIPIVEGGKGTAQIVFRDITDRRRAEQDLTLKNVILSTQQETSLDGILVVDERGKMISFNQRFVALWDIPPEVGASGSDERALQSVLDKLSEPDAFVARVAYLYEHREEESHEEIALKDGRTFDRYSAPMVGADGGYHGRVWYFRDITERKRAEQALRESETRLASLFAGIDDTIIVHDKEGRIIDCNDAACQRLGYSREELLALRTSDLEPPEFAAGFRERLEQQFRSGRFTGEGVHLTKDGRRIPVDINSSVFDYQGKKAVLAAMRDNSERKRAEEALRASEQRLQSLFAGIDDAIFVHDREGRIIDCNDAACRRLGYSREELLAMRTSDVDAPEFAVGFRERLEQQFRSGRFVGEGVHLTKDGRRIPVDINSGVIDYQGKKAVLATMRDSSERKRIEEALRRSEADFGDLVEHAPLGIYRATPQGRFVTVNPALIRMLGYGWAEEMLRLDIARDVYADPARRARLLAEFVHDETGAETEWKRKDGSRVTVRLNVRAVRGPGGQVEFHAGMVEDVTEQRSLEMQFRQAQRLEAVGRLAGGVAHDFNNVLTAITGYSDLLLEDLGPDDPKRSDVGEIKAAAVRATALTRQLLAFSRKQVFQTRVLDLNEVVETLDKMLHRLIGEDVKLEYSLASALGAVRADPGQIEQVILNLAVNSRDAMPSGGRLTIETANVDLDEAYAREHAGALPGRYVMLAVSDTGMGMDAEVRSHIFEPFYTTKELGKGTGLGLATVYGIVKQSGGYVWVYSEPGQGTTFKIYLPQVDEPPERLDVPVPLQPVAGGRETVLLAEDDPSVRAVVSEVLSQKGYRVLRAPDGQAALEMARGQPGEIDLLVTDIVMPGMTGRELAEALTAERPGIRVLYMSGYTDDAVVRHGVLAEGMPYLQKPFSPRALASKVREVLDRR